MEFIDRQDCEPLLDWNELTDAIVAGHERPRAVIDDKLLQRRNQSMLTRMAWIDGLGGLVKTAMVYPDNAWRRLPTVNGTAVLYGDDDGIPEAMVDFHMLTKWKTAADSALATKILGPPQASTILIVGAGTVAESMIEAYSATLGCRQFQLWNRTRDRAIRLAARTEERCSVEVVSDLETAVGEADIVCCATMSSSPIIRGEWLSPGTHVELIGSFTPFMREADDEVLRRGTIFVDSRETTLNHIGELKIPLIEGVIGTEDIGGDYYDLSTGNFRRRSGDEITVCKNGGGAHLDLMTASYITSKWRRSSPDN